MRSPILPTFLILTALALAGCATTKPQTRNTPVDRESQRVEQTHEMHAWYRMQSFVNGGG